MGGWRRAAVIVTVALLLLNALPVRAGVVARHWRVLVPARQAPTFYWPTNVAVDAAGNIDVLDRGNNRIVQLSPSGRVIRWWGGKGTRPGRLGPSGVQSYYDTSNGPPGAGGLAVDARSNVYVADTWNHRIEKFSSTGRLLAVWTDGLARPVDLAVDRHGTIFVADQGTNEIVKLSPRGTVLDTWTDLTVDTHGGLTPFALAVSPRGTVYVALIGGVGGCDAKLCWDGTVQYLEAYSSDGQAKASLTPDACSYAGGSIACFMTFDPHGNLLALSGNGIEIVRYAPSGKRLTPWAGYVDMRMFGTSGFAFDRQGNLYTTHGTENILEKRSPRGVLLATWGLAGSQPGQVKDPLGVAVNAQGVVAVLDAGNRRIQAFSTRGALLAHWRVPFNQYDYVSPSAIALDRQGNVYRAKLTGGNRVCASSGCPRPGSIVKYSKGGKLLATWTPKLTLPLEPVGLTLGPDGRLYVADAHHRVIVLTTTGRVVARWPTLSGTDLLGGIAVGPGGRTYVTERGIPGFGGSRIELFVRGRHRALWSHLPALGQVAVGINGGVYVAEPDKNRIVRFSAAGKVQVQWGAAGFEPGQFHRPTGVAVDSSGNLYVSDTGNERLQKRTARG